MKKALSIILTIITLLSFLVVVPIRKAYAANIEDNSVIVLSGKVNNQNELIIDANLTSNTGISGMTLELSYDNKVMTLSNISFGPALSSLDPITTNTKTSEGYAITPFKINYFGQENDYTKGLLFTLTFNLSNKIENGSYKVSLVYSKNQDVNYYDENGEARTKNLYIDNLEIQFKNNEVSDIITIQSDDKPKGNKTLLIVLIVSLSTLVTGSIVFVAFKLLKKKRNWKKI
jgi:hypothetical protein